MELLRAIGLLCRLLVIMSLMSAGFSAPASASGGPRDCMAMMHANQGAQADHASMPEKTPDAGKLCPLADFCATASVFLEPALASSVVAQESIAAALVVLDEEFDDGLTPLPPIRPPRI